ncbi:MAG TPA: ABC transporter permease [Actinomycetaceae bacterium]|nr:ABC transporter permease [Actinomycetaceae bacterium]
MRTTRLSPWRAALRIARRDALRHPLRTAIVVLLVALPVVAATFIGSAVRSLTPNVETRVAWELGDSAEAYLTRGHCDGPLWQDPIDIHFTHCADIGASAPADDREAPPVGALPPGSRIIERHTATVSVATADALVPEMALAITDTTAVTGLADLLEGRMPARAGEIVISQRLAERLDVGPGATIDVSHRNLDAPLPITVVGVDRHRTWEQPALALPGTVPLPDSDPTGWFVTGPSPVTWDEVTALNELGFVVTSRAVFLDPPPPSEVVYGAGDAGIDPQAIGLAGAVLAVALIEVVLLVGPAFAVSARRSERQLALVAAAGGAPRDLRRIVLAGGLVVGVLAGLVGALLGLVGAGVLYLALRQGSSPPPNFTLPSWEVPAAIGLAVLLGLAAAWVPARAAARADVVAALAGRRSPATRRSRVPWVGSSLLVLGGVGAVAGALLSEPIALVAGVVVMEVGVVLAAGGIISLAARLAPRMRAAGRFALRDAHRQRARTAPAIAAIIGAVAAATAGMTYAASEARSWEQAWLPLVAPDRVAVTLWHLGDSPDQWHSAHERRAALDAAQEVIDTQLPGSSSHRVRALEPMSDPVWLYAETNPDMLCPATAIDDEEPPDPRCVTSGGVTMVSQTWPGAVLVDDGNVLGAIGFPGADDAAAALARGEILVNSEERIWNDGTVRLMGEQFADPTGESAARSLAPNTPGHAVSWRHYNYDIVLPPQIVQSLDLEALGLEQHDVGILVVPPAAIDQQAIDELNAALAAIDGGLGAATGEFHSDDGTLATTIIAGAATIVALIATGLAVGLATAETRPDLATLAALGASPSLRRRVAGAQAGVIVVIGTAVGAATGLALGWVLALWQRGGDMWGPDWPFIVPWPALALVLLAPPTLAIVGAMALTRSRLPLVRRAGS